MTINNGISPVAFWRYVGFVFGATSMGFIADLSSGSLAIQLVGRVADAIHTNIVLSLN
jgi:hypothetical protein